MFSPRQRASFIESKIVSIVASACFCVTPRLTTRMLIRSDFSIGTPKAGRPPPQESRSGPSEPSRRIRNQQGIRWYAPIPRARARGSRSGRRPGARSGLRRRYGRRGACPPFPLTVAQLPERDGRETRRRVVLGTRDELPDEAAAALPRLVGADDRA